MSTQQIFAHRRTPIVDVLRGFALLGILLFNIQGFAYPMLYHQLLGIDAYEQGWQDWADLVVNVFVQGKFYTMFAFLFGYSVVLWLDKVKDRLERPIFAYVRRMLGLLVLGALHMVFVWWGDILLNYALCGLILLAFIRLSNRSLLIWAGGLLTAYASLLSLLYGLMIVIHQIDPLSWSQEAESLKEQYINGISNSLYVYSSGSLSEILSQRMQELSIVFESLPFAMISVLAMFLIGVAAARSQWLDKLQHDKDSLRQIMMLLAAGVVLTMLKTWGEQGANPLFPSVHLIVQTWGSALGDPLLSLAYVGLITRFLNRPERVRALNWVRRAGQMSLSHYLAQSLICTTIFYSYGFGMYGKLSWPASMITCLLVYITLLALGHTWLRRYSSGPIEMAMKRFVYLEQKGVKAS